MADRYTAIPCQVYEIVCTRAQAASSDDELGRIIYDALSAAKIDWQRVALEEVKTLLVAGLRARRQLESLHLAQATG